MSERRLWISPPGRRVSVLLAVLAGPATRLVRGLGAGVDAEAPEFRVSLGVGFGRLGDRVIGLVGSRSWDRCVYF